MPLTHENFATSIKARQWIEFGDDVDAAERIVPAAWIAELTEYPIRLRHAIIQGDLDLSSATFTYDVEMIRCEFHGAVDLSGSEFRRTADFSDSQFYGDVTLIALRTSRNLALRGCEVHGTTRLDDASVAGLLIASGARFRGRFSMERADIATLVLRPRFTRGDLRPTRFEGAVSLIDAHAGSISAEGVQFETEANFERLHVDRFAFFRVAVVDDDKRTIPAMAPTFGGVTTFRYSVLGREADFAGAVFKGTVNFRAADIKGRMILETSKHDPHRFRTRFEAKADFTTMNVEENFFCGGTIFLGPCEMKLMTIGGGVSFIYHGTGEAICARFKSDFVFDYARATFIDFRGVSFEGAALFERTVVTGDALFAPPTEQPDSPCRFLQTANFQGMSVNGDLCVNDAIFLSDSIFADVNVKGTLLLEKATFNNVDLRDAYAAALVLPSFSDGNTQTAIDARGLKFERIDGDSEAMLARQEPYELHLYQSVERFVRSTGDDDGADAIYLARRRRERRQYRQSQSWLRWSFSMAEDGLFRYGVRPLRLAVFSLFVLLIGTMIFSRPGAVEPKEKIAASRKLSLAQSLGYSLRMFMPIGDIPSGARWNPSERRLPWCNCLTFESYATMHRIAGLLLVPLGIAAATGVLVRKRT